MRTKSTKQTSTTAVNAATKAGNSTVAIGFRAKTGRAIAVVLQGSENAPEVLRRQDVVLSDPKVAESAAPYHAAMEVPWASTAERLRGVLQAIQRVSSRGVAEIAADLRASGAEIRGIGIVGGSAQDPARIGNPHVRAHAAEGQLFRRVLEVGAADAGLTWISFPEAELNDAAAKHLHLSPAALKARLTAMGRAGVRPWRAEEKAAALVAWIVLVRPTKPANPRSKR